MVIKLIEDQLIWDNFVNNGAINSVFHLWDFLKTVSKYTKYELLTYGYYNGEELTALIPLFHKRIYSFGFIFSPPPLSAVPYLGLLLSQKFLLLKQSKKEKLINDIFEELIKKINEYGPDYCSISFAPYMNDIRCFKSNGYEVEANYTYIMDLGEDIDKIWGKLDNYLRSKIKSHDELIVEDVADASFIYNSLYERYKEQNINIPIVSVEYLKELKRVLHNEMHLKIARIDDNIVGSEISLAFKDTAWDWIGGIRPKLKVPVNEIMKWKLIKEYKCKNFKLIDYVGGNNRNIASFKVQFQPDLRTYFVVSKKNLKGRTAETFYYEFIKSRK